VDTAGSSHQLQQHSHNSWLFLCIKCWNNMVLDKDVCLLACGKQVQLQGAKATLRLSRSFAQARLHVKQAVLAPVPMDVPCASRRGRRS
jgi:hypothetical protein